MFSGIFPALRRPWSGAAGFMEQMLEVLYERCGYFDVQMSFGCFDCSHIHVCTTYVYRFMIFRLGETCEDMVLAIKSSAIFSV